MMHQVHIYIYVHLSIILMFSHLPNGDFIYCKMANEWDMGWKVGVHPVSTILSHPMAIIDIITLRKYNAHCQSLY